MIVITGTSGFIASVLLGHLNQAGFTDILLVDAPASESKEANFKSKAYSQWMDRERFIQSGFRELASQINFVFHLGARTDTTEKDSSLFKRLNLDYSKSIWDICTEYQIPLIYASSAATYGLGEQGYADDHSLLDKLKPLNPYGQSKQDFDLWAIRQEGSPPFWAGLKFFNVYGPNEYHKGRMASVIWHAFRQIRETGKMKLFRSHKEGIEDGQQSRDFVYVKDVVKVCQWLMDHRPESGIYNVGSGTARSFHDLTIATFNALGINPDIQFIDTPADIRDTYQYYTRAEMKKLREAGFQEEFTSLESGVSEYVKEFLLQGPKIL